MEGLAILIGVDRFMSQARSITNMIGNTVATVVIAKNENLIDTDVYKQVVEKKQINNDIIFEETTVISVLVPESEEKINSTI